MRRLETSRRGLILVDDYSKCLHSLGKWDDDDGYSRCIPFIRWGQMRQVNSSISGFGRSRVEGFQIQIIYYPFLTSTFTELLIACLKRSTSYLCISR